VQAGRFQFPPPPTLLQLPTPPTPAPQQQLPTLTPTGGTSPAPSAAINFKGMLNEEASRRWKATDTIHYTAIGVSGGFLATAILTRLDGLSFEGTVQPTKKAAEQSAAKAAHEALRHMPD
jgi:hypothetical protein